MCYAAKKQLLEKLSDCLCILMNGMSHISSKIEGKLLVEASVTKIVFTLVRTMEVKATCIADWHTSIGKTVYISQECFTSLILMDERLFKKKQCVLKQSINVQSINVHNIMGIVNVCLTSHLELLPWYPLSQTIVVHTRNTFLLWYLAYLHNCICTSLKSNGLVI